MTINRSQMKNRVRSATTSTENRSFVRRFLSRSTISPMGLAAESCKHLTGVSQEGIEASRAPGAVFECAFYPKMLSFSSPHAFPKPRLWQCTQCAGDERISSR